MSTTHRIASATPTRCMALCVAVGALCCPRDLRAQNVPASPSEAARARSLDRPYTVAEVGLGVMTLPTTDICLTAPDTCTKGDTSPFGYVWMLYRASGTFAIGAGATYSPPVKSDTPQRTYANLDRSHKRQYLLIDVIGRYYALHLQTAEAWLGMTAGGVVVADQYKTQAENPSAPILGPQGVSIRTEGVTGGIAAGAGWLFAPDWSLEGSFRTAWWFLPSTKACAPTGDCATLSSDVAMFSLAIGVSYRIPL